MALGWEGFQVPDLGDGWILFSFGGKGRSEKFLKRLLSRSTYDSILQAFPVIQPMSLMLLWRKHESWWLQTESEELTQGHSRVEPAPSCHMPWPRGGLSWMCFQRGPLAVPLQNWPGKSLPPPPQGKLLASPPTAESHVTRATMLSEAGEAE